ncbi:glycosyltransferase [Verrucomicrobium sp. GAS474]|uniref:glycosyltransferase n=1 Tax=Verrucomicrobium sp. GAS474 TaxID=1882831 RepID=UPI0013902B31|nr:glycosyltransferase [Verrucomicrobium sp. GAS474]
MLLLHPWAVGEKPEAWERLTALVRYLSAGGAEVSLLLPDYRDPLVFSDLRITYFFPPDAVRNIAGIVDGLSSQEAYAGFSREELILLLRFQVYRDHPPFEAALDAAISAADVVLLDEPFWARSVGPLCKRQGKPLLLTSHGACCRAAGHSKAQKLFVISEVEAFRQADALFFRSAQDRDLFVRYGVAGEALPEGAGTDAERGAPYGAALARLTGGRFPAAAARKRGLVLLDPTLKIIHGHFFNYAKSISDAAQRAGISFLALGAQGIAPEITSQLRAVPTFRHGYLDELFRHPEAGTPGEGNAQYDFAMANIEFYHDLSHALPQVATSDTLFMPTLDHRQLLAWSWLLARWPAGLCPEVVLFFRMTYYRPAPDGSLALHSNSFFLAQGFAALQQVAVAQGRRIRLVTDSEGLAKEYRQWTSLPIEVVPIPHTVPLPSAHEGKGTAGLPPKKEGRLRFIILGDAREEKGIPLVALAVAQLAQRPDFAEMEFVLQAFIGSRHHQSMEPFLAALRRIAGENLTLVDRALDEAGYHELLTSADVVLIPYQKTAYFSRTSGIFTEAVANGKPVVVTEGTWMSGQLGDSGAGVLFEDGSAASLAEAILKAKREFPTLRENVLRLREGYLAYHNPDSFLNVLLGPAGADGTGGGAS